MEKIKTYRQYIEQTSFNKVWDILRSQYGETEDVKQFYIDLYEELKSAQGGFSVDVLTPNRIS